MADDISAWTQAGFKPVRTPAPSPSVIAKQKDATLRATELGMQATGVNIQTDRLRQADIAAGLEKAPVDKARAEVALGVEAATAEAQKEKALADARKARMEADAKEREKPVAGKLAPLEGVSETKTRIALGLGPAIEAQKNMYEEEGWAKGGGKNPFLSSPGAVVAKVTERIPLSGLLGGENFRKYQQAAKSWESAFLPIFSGQAVTPTEAQRQIKARLPAIDDSKSILSRKALERAMMMNGSADMLGQPRPFPRVGVLYPDPKKGGLTSKRPGVAVDEEGDDLPKGFKFLGPVKGR